MMRRIAKVGLLLIFALAASAGWGQSVAVRSGEHDGFTRLVVYLPQGVDAQVSRTDQGSRVSISRPVTFDLSQIYERINRDRFLDVSASKDRSALDLKYACDCQLRKETLVGNVLVLDLVGSPAVAAPDPAPKVTDIPTAVALPIVPERARPSLQDARRLTEQVTMAMPKPGPESDANRLARLAEMETSMIDQVARVATQGLLDIAEGGIEVQPEEAPEAIDVSKESPPAEQEKPPMTGGARMHTSLLAEDEEVQKVTSEGAKCLPELQVAQWSVDAPFGAALGERRTAVFGEFDAPDRDAIKGLARFYLSVGFGAEARSTLRMLDESDGAAALLTSVAHIMDHGTDPGTSPFAGMLDCESDIALWSVLATKPLPRDATVAKSSVLRALNTLPEGLRKILGPELADRFLASGDLETSQAVMRILDRTTAEGTSDKQFVSGKIKLNENSAEEGRQQLTKVVAQSSEKSPEALITLIDDAVNRGGELGPQAAELAGAYVVEYRNDPLAEDLARVEIRARAAAGQFQTAFGLIEQRTNENVLKQGQVELRSEVAEFLIGQGTDNQILRHGLILAANPDGVNADVSLDLAEAILSMGFPDVAFELTSRPQLANDPRARLIRSEAALQAGRPQRAEAELIGILSPEADDLRAQAQAAAGDFQAASQSFAAVNQPELAEESAWRAGDWDQLQNSEDRLNAALATLMRPGQTEAPDGVIASNRRLLQDTRASRQTLQEMLDRYSVEASE